MIDTKNLLLLAASIAVLAASFLYGGSFCILLKKRYTTDQHESTVDCSNYTVQDNDNLFEIVQKCGSSETAIVSANKRHYPSMTKNYIQGGWTLEIPHQQ